MKKIITTILLIIAMLVLWYAAIAFAAYKANPSEWSDPARALYSIVSLMTIALTAAARSKE